MRHRSLVQRAMVLLDSHDLRVAADAYCLLCQLLRCFGCDELLFDFARCQLRSEKDSASEWLRLEVDAQASEGKVAKAVGVPFAGRHEGIVTKLHERVAEALANVGGAPGEDGHGGMEVIRRVNKSNAEFCSAFKAEAGHILKWGLLVYLAKRNPGLCEELVASGLTETLLMCLLDVAHPVRQAAALAELHRVRLLSAQSQAIAQAVLVKQDLLLAMSLDHFMRSASADELARARVRLRNLRVQEQSHAYGAKEHGLQQQLMEKHMADTLGIQRPAAAFFMTQGQQAEEEKAGADKASRDAIPRSGSERFAAKRVPMASGVGQSYRVDRGPLEEVPFSGNLASFITDPLDVTADEESPLIQELRNIEAAVGLFNLGVVKRKAAAAAPPPARHSRKASHRPDLEHTRALALSVAPPRGSTLRAPASARASTSLRSTMQSRAESELTDISLQVGGMDDPMDNPFAKHSHSHMHSHGPGCGCLAAGSSMEKRVPPLHMSSMEETTVGPEGTMEWFETVSRQERSLITGGSDSLALMPSAMFSSQSSDMLGGYSLDEERLHTSVKAKTSVAAVSELQYYTHEGTGVGEPTSSVRKRTFHIARAPFHDCIAFDKGEIEHERARDADGVTQLLNPTTQRRFKELGKAGTFPRQWLVGSGGVQSARAMSPGSGGAFWSANTSEYALTERSYSPASADSFNDYRQLLPQLPPPGGAWSVPSRMDPVDSSAFMDGELSVRQDAQRESPGSLRGYFPASARSAY